MDCIFCKIASNEIPAKKVYEDDKFVAFLDIAPASEGHTLVIPKEHYQTFNDLPEELAGEMFKVVHKVAKAVVIAMRSEGYNILVNNYRAAGQVINHVHCHIIPRNRNDPVKIMLPQGKYHKNKIDEVAELIEKNL